MGYMIIPAAIFHNGNDFKILFDDKGGIASNVPQGNFQYFLSDSIVITNSASQYERAQTPDNIPSLMLFVKQKSNEFVLQKIIDLPRRESENMAAEGNVMNSIYTYVSQPRFYTYGGKIYASVAGSVFEIGKDGNATKITESSQSRRRARISACQRLQMQVLQIHKWQTVCHLFQRTKLLSCNNLIWNSVQ